MIEKGSVALRGLTLHVKDVEQSRSFYSRIPGAREAGHRPGQFALFEFDGGMLGLIQMPKAGFHIEIEAVDLDAMRERLIKAGLEPGAARERPWGERTFNLLDPDGHALEFQE